MLEKINTGIYFPTQKIIIPFFCCVIFIFFSCSPGNKVKKNKPDNSLTSFVDPFIGTGFHGHVFLGANVPFGAVQLGPVNISTGWDWCSGYHYSDTTIVGFSHTHLSGTGIGDLGDISFMPVTGNVAMAKGIAGDTSKGYYSPFTHQDEIAKPGYYAVHLERYDIKAELTATERVGFHQYTFPASGNAKIIIDLESGIGWDRPMDVFIEQLNDSTIGGYRFSKGWADDQRIFFTAVFSKPIKQFTVYDSSAMKPGNKLSGKKIRGAVIFATKSGEKIQVKVGISPVSISNAAGNIQAELKSWNFDEVVAKADVKWNAELNKIKVVSSDNQRLRNFYTAMYHTLIAPSVFNDANGDYRGTDKRVYPKASFTNYTTFSLWDTYRALHPLYTITQREKVDDIINSMLAIYQQQGKLPVWHLMGNETNTMPGYSGVQVVADAYLKGFRGYDTALAWQALKATAMQDERGLYFVKKYGYIPADSVVESVALGLEYSISDWGIAQVAKKMGKEQDHLYFEKRGKNYQYYFDPETKFMRGRISATERRTPFSPLLSTHRRDDFSEGNAWQYTWLVPQDVEGLIALMGGEHAFATKLDSLFSITGDMGEHASNDITGLVGQYAHGNEPSHHIPYFYAYVGQPWKTAERVRYILDSLYQDNPAGLSGNEDVGQMSAWYILSALGFYQVNPSDGKFVFGSPVMDEAVISLGDKKTFKIMAVNNSKTNIYIQGITLNGKAYDKNYINYKDIIAGGVLKIMMGPTPSKTWGMDKNSRP